MVSFDSYVKLPEGNLTHPETQLQIPHPHHHSPGIVFAGLVFALDQQIQQGIGVDHCLSEVGHHADQVGVPLVGNLREGPQLEEKAPWTKTFLLNVVKEVRNHPQNHHKWVV